MDQALPNMPAAVRAEVDAYKKSMFPGNPLEQDLKLELHNALLAKIPHSKHVLVPNSRHYIQNDAPALVIEAVRDIATHSTAGSAPRKP